MLDLEQPFHLTFLAGLVKKTAMGMDNYLHNRQIKKTTQ